MAGPASSQGVLHARRRRGQRERDQDRAPGHRAAQDRRALPQLSRRVDGRARPDRRLAPAAARARHPRRGPRPGLLLRSLSVRPDASRPASASARRTSARSCSSRARARSPRCSSSRCRAPTACSCRRRSTGRWCAQACDARRRAARRRRGAHRLRPHRQAVRLPALGRRARHDHRRQGPGRRATRTIGAVLVHERVAQHFDERVLACGLTYYAHPLGCAAALETLKVYEDEGCTTNAARARAGAAPRARRGRRAHRAAESFVRGARPARLPRDRGARSSAGQRSAPSSRARRLSLHVDGRRGTAIFAPPLCITEDELVTRHARVRRRGRGRVRSAIA